MSEIIGLFPTPIMRLERALDGASVDAYVSQIKTLRKTSNARSKLLCHTEIVDPARDEGFGRLDNLLRNHVTEFGKVLFGDLHILDESMQPCPPGISGTVWFKTGSPFEYFNDPGKTAEARSPDGTMSTVGDVGYIDADRYLYLTDRATFMIISGGVNIYPQECENLLITHPKIADAAVFGVPNADLGEEVKAVVQPMPGVAPGPALAEELIAFCAANLSRQKVPRSIDFAEELPRLPTGKLYKRLLRDKYWGDKKSRIV